MLEGYIQDTSHEGIVEMFRFDGGKKIYCLVSADLLDFDVSDRAEKLLEGYIQDTSHEGIVESFRLMDGALVSRKLQSKWQSTVTQLAWCLAWGFIFRLFQDN